MSTQCTVHDLKVDTYDNDGNLMKRCIWMRVRCCDSFRAGLFELKREPTAEDRVELLSWIGKPIERPGDIGLLFFIDPNNNNFNLYHAHTHLNEHTD